MGVKGNKDGNDKKNIGKDKQRWKGSQGLRKKLQVENESDPKVQRARLRVQKQVNEREITHFREIQEEAFKP